MTETRLSGSETASPKKGLGRNPVHRQQSCSCMLEQHSPPGAAVLSAQGRGSTGRTHTHMLCLLLNQARLARATSLLIACSLCRLDSKVLISTDRSGRTAGT